MTKTNAARILDNQDIKYELRSYEVDESDLSAVAVAEKLGQDPDQVFKTLVLRGDRTGVFVCIIPGAEELDLKKAAILSGNKKADLVPMKEILGLTGYIRGGCSPLGMKKDYPSFIDESCIIYEYIFVSAGIRGTQIRIAPDDLIRAASCITGDLIIMR
ncbi:MAG TPA: Cys-tRNA(Pro) deacylase [Bacteroidales bacterium]|jgi:Cys-tRNA(Pro)/Cys-tRNA(Cys) deacylase|nr:Cys-tRNA(Pro) deacylase [Bacteroidales bacterium]